MSRSVVDGYNSVRCGYETTVLFVENEGAF